MATTPAPHRAPYSLDQLAELREAPAYDLYIRAASWAEAFRLWQALRRDARLTEAEQDVRVHVRAQHLLGA